MRKKYKKEKTMRYSKWGQKDRYGSFEYVQKEVKKNK